MTVVLMTAMIVGAGTDYAVFLISRYHEYLRSGVDSDEAVSEALGSIGKVIAASAATVAVTFLGMIFTRLPAFTSVGPALAVSISIAFFAAITLLPAIRRAGRPSRVGHASGAPDQSALAALGGPARPAAQIPSVRQPGRPDRAGLMRLDDATDLQRPHATARIGREQPGLLRDGRTLLDKCAAAGIHLHPVPARSTQSQVPGRYGADGAACGAAAEHHHGARHHPRRQGNHWIRPRSAIRPVQVGSKLADASSQISSKTSDLDALSSGAQKLADTLGSVRDQIRSTATSMTAMTGTLTQVQQQLASPQTTQLLDAIRSYANNDVAANANAMLAALNNSPQCDADPACSDGRAKLQQLAGQSRRAGCAGQGRKPEHSSAVGRRRSAVREAWAIPLARNRRSRRWSRARMRWPKAASSSRPG